jgi:hypothetical protein
MDEISYGDKCVTRSKYIALLKTKRLERTTLVYSAKLIFSFVVLNDKLYLTKRNENLSYAC